MARRPARRLVRVGPGRDEPRRRPVRRHARDARRFGRRHRAPHGAARPGRERGASADRARVRADGDVGLGRRVRTRDLVREPRADPRARAGFVRRDVRGSSSATCTRRIAPASSGRSSARSTTVRRTCSTTGSRCRAAGCVGSRCTAASSATTTDDRRPWSASPRTSRSARRPSARSPSSTRVSRALATATTLASATTPLLRGVGRGARVGGRWHLARRCGRDALRFVGGWQLDDAVGARIVAASQTLRLERGRGLPGRILATGRPLWLDDFSERTRFPRRDAAVADGLRAAFGFPITLGDEVLGVVEFFSRRIRDPDESQLDLMAAIGAQVGQFVERTQTQVELAESEARKSAVFESALEGIVTMDAHGHILELNPAAAEMFGYERDDVVGRELAEVFVPPAYRDRHRDALERYRRTGRGRILGRRLELVGMRADGTEFPIELAVNRVALPDADEMLFTGTVRDITPRRRAEELQAVAVRERAGRPGTGRTGARARRVPRRRERAARRGRSTSRRRWRRSRASSCRVWPTGARSTSRVLPARSRRVAVAHVDVELRQLARGVPTPVALTGRRRRGGRPRDRARGADDRPGRHPGDDRRRRCSTPSSRAVVARARVAFGHDRAARRPRAHGRRDHLRVGGVGTGVRRRRSRARAGPRAAGGARVRQREAVRGAEPHRADPAEHAAAARAARRSTASRSSPSTSRRTSPTPTSAATSTTSSRPRTGRGRSSSATCAARASRPPR